MQSLIHRIDSLNERNERLAQAFDGDTKYARSFKKVVYDFTGKEVASIRDNPFVYTVMKDAKNKLDDEIAQNNAVVSSKPYLDKMTVQLLLNSSKKQVEKMSLKEIKHISDSLTDEYYDEYEGVN